MADRYSKFPFLYCLPIRGTASEVVGMISDTKFMKTVSDRRTVTSVKAPINTKLEISIIIKLLKICVYNAVDYVMD